MPIQTGPDASVASCTMGTASLRVKKRPEFGADHPLCSSTALRIGWSYTSARSIHAPYHELEDTDTNTPPTKVISKRILVELLGIR